MRAERYFIPACDAEEVIVSTEAAKISDRSIRVTFDMISGPLVEVKIIRSRRNRSIAAQIRSNVDTQQTLRVAGYDKLSNSVGFAVLNWKLEFNALSMEVFTFPF